MTTGGTLRRNRSAQLSVPDRRHQPARLPLPDEASPPIVRAMTNARLSTVAALVFAVSMFGAGIGCGESGSGTAGAGGAGGSGGSGGSAAPVITKVQWDWADDPCMTTTSTVSVTVFATDDQTQSDELVYSLAVSDCTPAMVSDVSVSVVTILDCPLRNPDVPRTGTVIVTDPEGNSDTVMFGFTHCNSDEVCEGGNPCD